jgi:hypothetical protein
MNVNIKNINSGRSPVDLRANFRYHSNETGNEETKTKGIDWNNLITNVGNSFSSVFGYLTASKASQLQGGNNQQYKGNSNSVMWIGIAVVAVIVIGLVIFLRKK